MFDWFRADRIESYVRGANRYVNVTFKNSVQKKPDPAKKTNANIRYKMPRKSCEEDIQYSDRDSSGDSGIRYSLRDPSQEEDVQYSYRCEPDAIPNSGDAFAPAGIKQFFKQNGESPSLDQLAGKLDRYLDLTFVDILTRYISEKGWRDSRVYKAAQMDRRLFSKIMSDRLYKPSKDTALALAIALELSLTQTNDLLSRAGYTLSHSSKRDVIIEYFIREGIHNLCDINEVLYRLDQKIIGR